MRFVHVVDALGLGRVGDDGHHRPAQRRHQRVALGEVVARDVVLARRRHVASARVGGRQLFLVVVGVEHRDVDDLLALEVGDAQMLALADVHCVPGLGRHHVLVDRLQRIAPS
jgi:hypothetical protein